MMIQTKCKISVITVCFNAENVIEKTIKSVVNQSYKDKEYIIIDGKSTDETMSIISRYKNDIQIIVSEPDEGIYDAMNKAIKIAHGEWVCFMNAGDVFRNNDVLENVFNEPIPSTATFLYSDIFITYGNEDFLCPMNFSKGGLIHQAIIYKRNSHKKYGEYIVTHPIIVSDYLFFIRFHVKEVFKLKTIIAIYEGGGVSSQNGNWARIQSLCADVVFRRRSFANMIMTYLGKEIADFLPRKIKMGVKKVLFK